MIGPVFVLRFVAIALLLTSLTACAALGVRGAPSADDAAKISRVGVISLLGNNFHGVSIGTTIFNNEYFEGNVPEWEIDRFAESRILELLGSNPRLTVARFEYKPTLEDGLISKEGAKKFFAEAKKQAFDTLVVVDPSGYDNAPHLKPGYGLFDRSFLGAEVSRCTYSLFIVEVLDVQSEKRTGWQWSFDPWTGHPCQGETSVAWKGSFDQYTSQERDEFRRLVEKETSDGVRIALVKLNLLPKGE